MTVRELIARLASLPLETEVYISNHLPDPDSIDPVKFITDDRSNGRLILESESETEDESEGQ